MSIRKPIQLLIIILGTAVAAAFTLLNVDIPVVRAALALFLIFAVGHTTLMAWANHLALRGVVRGLMTIVLGITLMIVGGFVLNFTAWGLETRTWVFLVSAIIVFNSLIALLRKSSPASEIPSTSVQTWRLELNAGQFVLLILAVVVASASIMVARNGALNEANPKFSQLWMLADTTPNSNQAVLGIKNDEQQPFTYHLQIVQGTTVVQDFPSISLEPDATWQGKVDLTGLTATNAPLEARLYRDNDQTEPYRTAQLWLQ